MISYEMPLNEVILDFHDKLKSRTQGYASLDYAGYRNSDLVKLDILPNGEAMRYPIHSLHTGSEQ